MTWGNWRAGRVGGGGGGVQLRDGISYVDLEGGDPGWSVGSDLVRLSGTEDGWTGGLQVSDCELYLPVLGQWVRDRLDLTAIVDVAIPTPADGMLLAFGTRTRASAHRFGVAIERVAGAWRVQQMTGATPFATQALTGAVTGEGHLGLRSVSSNEAGGGTTESQASYSVNGGARGPQSVNSGAATLRVEETDAEIWIRAVQPGGGDWTVTFRNLLINQW